MYKLKHRIFILKFIAVLHLAPLGHVLKIYNFFGYNSSPIPIAYFCTLTSISFILLWNNKLFVWLCFIASLLSFYFLFENMTIHAHQYHARYHTTKSNLENIRTAINLYHSNHLKFPLEKPKNLAFEKVATKEALETVLNSSSPKGNNETYIIGSLPGELISSAQGNNFVCIIKTIREFQTDQSGLQNCNSHNPSNHTQGGYLYFPKDGLIRLNFKVHGLLPLGKESHVGELFFEWHKWADKFPDYKRGYPVLW